MGDPWGLGGHNMVSAPVVGLFWSVFVLVVSFVLCLVLQYNDLSVPVSATSMHTSLTNYKVLQIFRDNTLDILVATVLVSLYCSNEVKKNKTVKIKTLSWKTEINWWESLLGCKNKTIPRIAARLSRLSKGCVKYLDMVMRLHFLHIKPSDGPVCCTTSESHHKVNKPVVIKYNSWKRLAKEPHQLWQTGSELPARNIP